MAEKTLCGECRIGRHDLCDGFRFVHSGGPNTVAEGTFTEVECGCETCWPSQQVRRCTCGAVATHQIDERIPSNVGVATRTHSGCTRCIERLAKVFLLGESIVEVRTI